MKLNAQLAIVIPCYKDIYLKETLESLVNQTNQNFNVYIGNDAGSLQVDKIVAEYREKLALTYKRFEDNLGKTSLVRQWDRCINLIRNEQWIWLLPDDDYLEKNCVERFLEAIEENPNIELFRFNTIVVDEIGQKIDGPHLNPNFEEGISFIADKLSGTRRSSIAEYIFSRRRYQDNGFLEFPLAWCSDDASWLLFSQKSGIQTITNSFVYVRISKDSISGDNNKLQKLKLKAGILFLFWLKTNYFERLEKEFKLRNTSFDKVTQRWYLLQLLNKNHHYGFAERIQIIHSSIRVWGIYGVRQLKFYYFILRMI